MPPRTKAEEEADALDNSAPWAIEAIRRNERHRLADLLEQNAGTLAGFAGDKEATLAAVVFLLRLDKP